MSVSISVTVKREYSEMLVSFGGKWICVVVWKVVFWEGWWNSIVLDAGRRE